MNLPFSSSPTRKDVHLPLAPRPKGFTLLELLIVILILSILFLLALPQYITLQRNYHLRQGGALIAQSLTQSKTIALSGGLSTPSQSKTEASLVLLMAGEPYFASYTTPYKRGTTLLSSVSLQSTLSLAKQLTVTETGPTSTPHTISPIQFDPFGNITLESLTVGGTSYTALALYMDPFSQKFSFLSLNGNPVPTGDTLEIVLGYKGSNSGLKRKLTFYVPTGFLQSEKPL